MNPIILCENSIRRIVQKENYCGPAILEMLFSFFSYHIDQETIAEASGILNTINEFGSRIDQLGRAVKILLPQYSILGKRESRIDDIEYVISNFHIPVVVEWQSKFQSPEGICVDEV